MCFKRNKIDDRPFERVPHRLVTFGKNRYGGGASLPGCINDSRAFDDLVRTYWPECDVRMHLDGQVTVNNYKMQVRRAIATLSPGAVVVVFSDSCHSESITRGNPFDRFNGRPIVSRYYPNPDLPVGLRLPRHDRAFVPQRTHSTQQRRVYEPLPIRWLVWSACMEHQTASDAWFSDIKTNMGASSYTATRTYEPGMTWHEWFMEAKARTIRFGFDQVPTLEGPLELKLEKVGENETLIIHNSSHGSQVFDVSGDELDGLDETLYFDRHLLDDDIHMILQEIP